jgi:hypothetical protein
MSPEHLDPSERTLPEWLDELADASQKLAGVEHSLALMREAHHYIDEVIWQARWRHRDECKAQVAIASRGAMARRAALVERVMERLPVPDAFERLQLGGRLGDLDPAQLEFLAALRFEAPPPVAAALGPAAARHRQWYVDLSLASDEYHREHHVRPSQHALATKMDRPYSTIVDRLTILRGEGYDTERLLQGQTTDTPVIGLAG